MGGKHRNWKQQSAQTLYSENSKDFLEDTQINLFSVWASGSLSRKRLGCSETHAGHALPTQAIKLDTWGMVQLSKT